MSMILKLRQALAANANANPQDVLAAKTFLQDQGFYHSPDWGLSQFPDRAMFDGLKAFQKSNGLRVDGVMNPGGESEATTQRLQAHALNLQSLGRNGDTILAHINPAEAQLLKAKGGAGTINPNTGLLEFFKADKNADTKKGKYTWHTVGDGNVRPSHAERNGKVFSWDTPPDDGHPGEAYNCRCTAEDVGSDEQKCKELKHIIANQEITVHEAEKEREQLQAKLERASELQISFQNECDNSLESSVPKIGAGAGGGWITGGAWGAARGSGEAVITSVGDVYDACSMASSQKDKVDELTKRRDSALEWMNEQRAILKDLRDEFTSAGCDP